MRDLFFKNCLSADRRRKIVSSSEIADTEGIHSIIRRHFILMVKEIEGGHKIERPLPAIHIVKERNSKEQRSKFLFKLKGSVYILHNGKLFLILFMHSLSVNLTAIPAPDLINT